MHQVFQKSGAKIKIDNKRSIVRRDLWLADYYSPYWGTCMTGKTKTKFKYPAVEDVISKKRMRKYKMVCTNK